MIEILACGFSTTIQDLGRSGYRDQGIGTSGAMDRLALRTGNILVGNIESCAAVETTGSPLRIQFKASVAFAATGAPARVTLNDKAVPWSWALRAEAGDVVEVLPSAQGMWNYLCVGGGIATPVLLGSRSTDLKSGFGGPDGGLALTQGSVLPMGEPTETVVRSGFGVIAPLTRRDENGRPVLRVIPAREYDCFTADSQEAFWTADWSVAAASNRQGYRLSGPALRTRETLSLSSYGLVPGVVQVPPAGHPLIQLSEANTCGGYPKIGVVIGADLRILAQGRPGSRLRVERTDQAGALAALRAERDYSNEVRAAVRRAVSAQ